MTFCRQINTRWHVWVTSIVSIKNNATTMTKRFMETLFSEQESLRPYIISYKPVNSTVQYKWWVDAVSIKNREMHGRYSLVPRPVRKIGGRVSTVRA